MKLAKNSNNKLLNKSLVMIALLAPLIEPSGLEDLSVYVGGVWRCLHLLVIAFKWISFIVVFLLSLQQFKKWEIITWLFVGYQALIAIMTMLNSGLTISHVSNLLTPMVTVLLFQYYMKDGSAFKFLRIAQLILGILIILNLITIIVRPNGMYIDDRGWVDNWILGYRNLHIYYFLPFLAIYGIVEYIKRNRIGIGLYVMVIFITISSALSRSITTLFAIAFVALFIGLFENNNLPKILSIRNICLVSFVLSILFIFFSFQNHISGIFGNILGRDFSTFSRRTLIWARAAADFFEKPLFGYGIIKYEGIFKSWDVGQMHNMYLDVLVVGGLALLSVFALLINLINNKVNECQVPAMRNTCTFIFIGYSILFIAEARRDTTLLFVFMSLCYYLPLLVDKYQIKDNKKRLRIKFKR